MSCFLLTCLEMFVKMLCESLHKEIHYFPLYAGSFAENFVCNPESSAGNLDEHATWYQWEHVEQIVQAKKGKRMKRVKKIQKVPKEG